MTLVNYFDRSPLKWIWIAKAPVTVHSSYFGTSLSCCSVTTLCTAPCNCMGCSTPGFLALHYLHEFDQTHVHRFSDATQPSNPHVISVSFCLQSSAASGPFAVSQLFTSGGQRIGASALATASVLLMNIQSWFPLGLTGLIALLSEGLSRVLSSTAIQKHQFFSTQPSLWSNSHIYTWLLEKP